MQSSKTKLFVEASSLTEPRTSGIGNTVLNIVRHLSNDQEMMRDFSIELVVPFNKTKYLTRYGFNDRVSVKKLWLPGKVSNLLTKLRLMPVMDLFYGKGVYLFPNYKNWPLIRSQSITYVHDMAHLRHPEFIEEKNLRYLNAHLGEWMKRTSKIITVSEHAKDEIRYFFPNFSNKIVRVYNGYDSDQFTPTSSSDDKVILDKYGLTNGKYFLFLSNIEPRKNVMKLLEAFDLLCAEKGTDYKLLLVGGMGWRNEEVSQKIRAMQAAGMHVIRPDHFVEDEDLPSLMRGSIGLVHPALYEGFGISPLQAMACGKHVVVGDNSSIPEVVGGAGIYVNVSSVESIKDGMVGLLKNTSVENTAGIERARQFTWSHTLADLKDVIEDCAKRI